MRLALLMLLATAVGCAGRPSLEELEREALMTGEWSAVKAREAARARHDRRLGPDCPKGAVTVCYETGLAVDCGCGFVAPSAR